MNRIDVWDVSTPLFALMMGVGIFFLLMLIGFEKEDKKDLPMSYEVIKAESQEDAISKSVWEEGDLARVVGLTASSNSKGTYSVFPEFEKVDIGELDLASGEDE
jgi:hypothetical protein